MIQPTCLGHHHYAVSHQKHKARLVHSMCLMKSVSSPQTKLRAPRMKNFFYFKAPTKIDCCKQHPSRSRRPAETQKCRHHEDRLVNLSTVSGAFIVIHGCINTCLRGNRSSGFLTNNRPMRSAAMSLILPGGIR